MEPLDPNIPVREAEQPLVAINVLILDRLQLDEDHEVGSVSIRWRPLVKL